MKVAKAFGYCKGILLPTELRICTFWLCLYDHKKLKNIMAKNLLIIVSRIYAIQVDISF